MTDDSQEDVMVIALQADPETWMPKIVLGFPLDGVDSEYDEDLGGYLTKVLNPDGAFKLGIYISQQALMAQHLEAELEPLPLEEREEIIQLYATYHLPDAEADD